MVIPSINRIKIDNNDDSKMLVEDDSLFIDGKEFEFLFDDE